MIHALLHNSIKHLLTLFYKIEFTKPIISAGEFDTRLAAAHLRSKLSKHL